MKIQNKADLMSKMPKRILYLVNNAILDFEFVSNSFSKIMEGEIGLTGRKVVAPSFHKKKWPWSEQQALVIHDGIEKVFVASYHKIIKTELEKAGIKLNELKGIRLHVNRIDNNVKVSIESPCRIDYDMIDQLKHSIFSSNLIELSKKTHIRISKLRLLKESGLIRFEIQTNIS